jgi:anti-sigma28 factor (negative regulator of flagellin synthesis)
MKIHNDGLQGSNPIETGRTQGTPPSAAGSKLAGQKVAGTEGDSVEISGISAHLAESNSADGQKRSARVAELAALYAKGEYRTNSTQLSKAIVSHAIGAAEGGSK